MKLGVEFDEWRQDLEVPSGLLKDVLFVRATLKKDDGEVAYYTPVFYTDDYPEEQAVKDAKAVLFMKLTKGSILG